MNVSRRDFISLLGAGAAAAAVPGCMCVLPCRVNAKLGVSLHSIREYIGGKKGTDGSVLAPGVGLVKAFRALSAIGYKGVEFSDYYGNDAKTLKTMLDDSGLVACGMHAGSVAFAPDKIAETCEFNLGFGNNLIVCDGDGNFPKKGEKLDDFLKELVDYYNTAAATAAKYGCRIGLCNHVDEFTMKTSDGTAYWDYFFTHADPLVCMEQSVALTAKAGEDPCEQFRKFPHRSPTLCVQEAEGAVSVDWDSLVPVAAQDGVSWFVVACEYPCDDLSAVLRSHSFFRAKIGV